ncbi:MAG: TetR/AcrR family transcriptional regulator, partial [Thermoanaerobaculia bacterium]
MATHGYERTSVARIARAAGLTPGLIHYHFDSKQEILLALVERIRQVIRERLGRRLARAGHGARARLFAYIDAHLALGPDSDPEAMACWVAIGAEALRQPEVRKIYAEALDQDLGVLEGLLRDLLSSEGRSTHSARAMAAGLLATIEGAYRLGCAAPGTIP